MWGWEAPVIAIGVAIVVFLQWRESNFARRIATGDFEGSSLGQVVPVLWNEYGAGRVRPDFLARLPTAGKLGPNAVQQVVCLDIAAGRYVEALRWQTQPRRHVAENERLLLLNLAEARACLGQLDEALSMTEFAEKVQTDFLRAGLASHRAWVLSELGRPAEAREQLERTKRQRGLLGPFEAEWHFSAFAVAFAERNWVVAEAALDDAERVAVRGTTKRNLHFLRGRLAFARGELERALGHFEEGGRHVYRCQGGPALLDWGRALQQLGRIDEARTIWERCRAEDPQSPAALEAARLLTGS